MGSIHREIEEREGPCVLSSGQMGEAVRMEVSRNNRLSSQLQAQSEARPSRQDLGRSGNNCHSHPSTELVRFSGHKLETPVREGDSAGWWTAALCILHRALKTFYITFTEESCDDPPLVSAARVTYVLVTVTSSPECEPQLRR